MIWQFGELGYDISINQNGRTGNKPILWNYLANENRRGIKDTWSKLIQLKLKYDIFKTSNFTLNVGNANGLKTIHLTKTDATNIKQITIIGNFGVTTQNVIPNFQQTGTWFNLLDNNSTINVTNTTAQISLAPGEFKVYADMPATLSTDDDLFLLADNIMAYPNPTTDSFQLNKETNHVIIYDITGKMVKEFKGNFSSNKLFSVKNLEQGLYFVKINKNNFSLKLVKY